MFPVHADVCRAGIGQPLIFINSFDFQWKENVASMMEVLNESNRQGDADIHATLPRQPLLKSRLSCK